MTETDKIPLFIASNNPPPDWWIKHRDSKIPLSHSHAIKAIQELEGWDVVIYVYVEDKNEFMSLDKEHMNVHIKEFKYIFRHD